MEGHQLNTHRKDSAKNVRRRAFKVICPTGDVAREVPSPAGGHVFEGGRKAKPARAEDQKKKKGWIIKALR